MWALVILALVVILGIVAWYVFRNAEAPPERVREDFEKRRAAGLVRDDTGRNPDDPVRRFRWWSR